MKKACTRPTMAPRSLPVGKACAGHAQAREEGGDAQTSAAGTRAQQASRGVRQARRGQGLSGRSPCKRASIGLNALAEMTPVTKVEPVAKKTYLRARGGVAGERGAGQRGSAGWLAWLLAPPGRPTAAAPGTRPHALCAPRAHFMASPSATEALLVGMYVIW